MLELPDYFVRKVSGYPAGFKLSKMKHLVEDTPKSTWLPGMYGGMPAHLRPIYPSNDRKGDPLNGGDYRYWKAYRDSDFCLTACRCCGSVFSLRDARKAHMNDNRCGAKLEEAFKRLRKTNDCLICGVPTHQKAYGLPLCCKDCVNEWEYVTATPDKLRKILKEIGDR